MTIGTGAVLMWLGLACIESYSSNLSELIDSNPDQARMKMMNDFRLIAIATGAAIWVLAIFLSWYGVKSLRTRSMPPRNSWVVEGHRIRTGPAAVFRAKMLLATSVILLLFGTVAAAMLWRLPVEFLASQ